MLTDTPFMPERRQGHGFAGDSARGAAHSLAGAGRRIPMFGSWGRENVLAAR